MCCVVWWQVGSLGRASITGSSLDRVPFNRCALTMGKLLTPVVGHQAIIIWYWPNGGLESKQTHRECTSPVSEVSQCNLYGVWLSAMGHVVPEGLYLCVFTVLTMTASGQRWGVEGLRGTQQDCSRSSADASERSKDDPGGVLRALEGVHGHRQGVQNAVAAVC